jgi:hypothetical protein
MADANSALGGPEIAGAWINKTGTAKRVMGTVAGAEIGGIVGAAVAARIAAGETPKATAETPEFGAYGYLALGTAELILVRAKQGMTGMKLTDEVAARVPRTAVASAVLGEGKVSATFTINFADGGSWDFEVARARRRGAEGLVAEFGG